MFFKGCTALYGSFMVSSSSGMFLLRAREGPDAGVLEEQDVGKAICTHLHLVLLIALEP